jgi:hypothetical protein
MSGKEEGSREGACLRASHRQAKTRRRARIETLIAELCPEGVEFKALGEVFVPVSQ